MPASIGEISQIVDICLGYLPEEDLEELAQELWEEVGEKTDNDSLKQTLAALRVQTKIN